MSMTPAVHPAAEADTAGTQRSGPLSRFTIVDLTRVLAGPYCTLLLADLGARVIKVEQPGEGDDARRIGPFIDGRSAYFLSVNRNKESIALNLREPADRAIFESLLDQADVLVENYRPGAMERLGYGWDAVHARWPRLVMTSVSGFGQTGPYRQQPAYDMVVQAMGGMMSLTGHPGGPPTRVGASIGDLGAGLYAALGTQAALLERERSGEGRHVDVAMLDCQVAMLENALSRLQAEGRTPGPIGSRHPSITPFDVFRAADGWLVIAAGNDALFKRLCGVLQAPALAEDARFLTNALRCEHEPALKQAIEACLAPHGAAHWQALLREAGIPTGPFNTVADVVRDPQVQAREMLLQVEAGPQRPMTVAGNPIKLSGHRTAVWRQPPQLDADRERLLAEFVRG